VNLGPDPLVDLLVGGQWAWAGGREPGETSEVSVPYCLPAAGRVCCQGQKALALDLVLSTTPSANIYLAPLTP
jgi:hypothetical protein